MQRYDIYHNAVFSKQFLLCKNGLILFSAVSECPTARGFPAAGGKLCCKYPVSVYNPSANPECNGGGLHYLSPAECGFDCLSCPEGHCFWNEAAELDDGEEKIFLTCALFFSRVGLGQLTVL